MYHLLLLLFITPSICFGQRVAFLMDDYNAERWHGDSVEFYKEATNRGVDVFIYQCDSDPHLQLQQTKMAIDSLHVDAIVLVSSNRTENKTILKFAAQKEVPVILYDRTVEGPHYQHLSFDSHNIGYLQAKHVLKNEHVTNVVLLNGPTFDSNATLFRNGQMAALQPEIEAGRINVLLDIHLSEWTDLEAFMQMNDFLLGKHPQIHAVIAANDGIAKGAIEAMELNGISDVVVTGQDGAAPALKAIKEGRQSYTILKPVDLLVQKALDSALDAYSEKQIIGHDKTVYIDVVEVTRENVEKYVK